LQAELCDPCADATVTVNTAPFGTAPSGGALNVPVKNTAGTLKGSKIGSDWVVPDATLQQNTIQRKLIPTGTSFNLVTKLDGVANNGVWDGVDTLDFTSAASGSIAVTVSDATPNFGDSITITATPTGFAPTSYLFFAFDGTDITFIAEQAGASVNWPVTVAGTYDVGVMATDGTTEVYGLFEITVVSGYVCDLIATQPIWGVELRRLTAAYTGPAGIVRRSSDNATLVVGYIGEDLDVAALTGFVGVGNGFAITLYDQFGWVNAVQYTAAAQPSVVVSGTVQVINGRPTLLFDGTTDEMILPYDVTGAHFFCVEAKSSDTNLVQFVLGGTGQGIRTGGTILGAGPIGFATLGGILNSTVNDTSPHCIAAKCGIAGTGRLTIDGVVVATGTTSASMTFNRIGTRPDAPALRHIGRFSGAIAYASALSDADEAIIHNNYRTYYGTA